VRRRDDRGETLIELLVSITIMGITTAAIIGAVFTVAISSNVHRNQVTVLNQLRTSAEIVNRAESADFFDCAVPFQVAMTADMPWYSVANTVFVQSVTYWDAASSSFTSTCNHLGLLRVTLEIDQPRQGVRAYTQTLDVVVRRPCATSC
jgi:type II secretory pathway pseudopilin PulG